MTTPEVLKQRASQISVERDSGHAWLQELICEGYFDTPVSSKDVVKRIAERFSRRWTTSRVQIYLRKFVGIVQAIKPAGLHANFWVLASVSRSDALVMIGKSRRVVEIEESLFAPELEAKLQKSFSNELSELRGVFGKYGNSSAFLLRKILEKLLVISFRKVGKGDLIEDSRRPGGLIGLESMIELAMREKVNVAPILTGKTGNAIKGVKFLGDTAAHNPMANVDVSEILPQMPYMVTAYKELALHL
jgi:hypothetical protein